MLLEPHPAAFVSPVLNLAEAQDQFGCYPWPGIKLGLSLRRMHARAWSGQRNMQVGVLPDHPACHLRQLCSMTLPRASSTRTRVVGATAASLDKAALRGAGREKPSPIRADEKPHAPSMAVS